MSITDNRLAEIEAVFDAAERKERGIPQAMEMGRVLEAAHDLLDEVRRASKTNSEMAGSLMRVILAIWPKGSQIAEADLNADIPEKIAAMRLALENVRALAARLRRSDPATGEQLLRFCREGGVEGSVLRSEDAP